MDKVQNNSTSNTNVSLIEKVSVESKCDDGHEKNVTDRTNIATNNLTNNTRNMKVKEREDDENNSVKKFQSVPVSENTTENKHDTKTMLDLSKSTTSTVMAPPKDTNLNKLDQEDTMNHIHGRDSGSASGSGSGNGIGSSNNSSIHNQYHHHHRVYSHHSTSPILPLTPEYGPSSHPLPPQDFLIHPLTDHHGHKAKIRTIQNIQSTDVTNQTNVFNSVDSSTSSSSLLTFQSKTSSANYTKENVKQNSTTYPNSNNRNSTHSSPAASDTFQHKPLQRGYRTFSFDGKMFRNNSNVYPNPPQHNTNTENHNMYYKLHNSQNHDETDQSLHLRRHSSFFHGQFPRHYETDYLQPMVKQKKHSFHANISEDHNQGEMQSLLSSNQHGQYHSEGNLYDAEVNRINSNVIRGDEDNKTANESKGGFFYYFVYALLNTMMSVPSLYGYASVIFNHSAFQPHIATLSKLVIWSSAVHQFCFVCASSISFAKAEVQDAGLIFLSCISQFIAGRILDEEGTIEEIISTTVVALGIATASLGLMLMLMGRFKLANAVSYLPLPVVGGYLAFIGYFCVIAGVGLCISKSMIDGSIWSDLEMISDRQSLMLALPGIVSGLIMMLVARYATNDIALPSVMVMLPSLFYLVLHFSKYSMDDAREYKWVGEVRPHASLMTLVDMLDFNLVRWDLVFSSRCITVWVGMVFVVSFSSCLDVAAISMDMGEPLDVNKELVTVGLSNLFSGALGGQTGSYIFSQTILTYRTGFLSRWIGFIGSMMFLYFALSQVNLLEIAPLYFLGSTLIFIGVDLLYEWIIEVSYKLLLSEYIVLLATFIAILWEGIDAGIIVGLIVAVVEYVITSSQLKSLRRVMKRSRAVWEPEHRRLLQDVVYDSRNPKIICLEITETVFFGSSLQLFSQICDEIGLDTLSTDIDNIAMSSPRLYTGRTPPPMRQKQKNRSLKHGRPRYVVLDMSLMANVDASAARSCFLQLAKKCSKFGVVLCACGVNSRVDWILRSHDVAYNSEEEDALKRFMLYPLDNINMNVPKGKLLLFLSMNECLELCENQLIYEFKSSNLIAPPKLGSRLSRPNLLGELEEEKTPLSVIFGRILGMESREEKHLLTAFDVGGSAEIGEMKLVEGQRLFIEDEISDAFYVVLCGSVTIGREEEQRRSIRSMSSEHLPSIDITSSLSAGGIFGYVDFAIQRRRSFNAVCANNGTVVAKISNDTMEKLKLENATLHHIIEKVLLQASLLELANIDVC